MKIRIALLLVPVMMLAACDRHKNKNPFTNAKETLKDTSIQGKVYESDCSVQPVSAAISGVMTGGQASVKGARTQYKFEGANVERRTLYFTAADCSGPIAFTFDEIGEVDIKDDHAEDGARFMDMSFKNVELQIESEDGAKVANAINMCRSNKWSKGDKQDVTPMSSDPTCYNGTVPRQVANIYKRDGDTLYFGSTAKKEVKDQNRPTSLDKGDAFKAR